MTTAHDKSTNPSMNTAAETVDTTGAAAAAPHTIATGYEGSVRDQIDYYIQRVRGGEMGMLPALGGLVVLSLLFWAATPFFFTKTNIANLMTQTAALMMLAMALTFVIILAEIDLSAGVTGGLGMAIFILLTNLGGWNWIAALLVSFARRRGDRHLHRLLRRSNRRAVVRHHPGPVPGPAGGDPRAARQRRRLPHRGAGRAGDHEPVDAGLGRLGHAGDHRRHLAGHRALRPQPAGGHRHAGPSDEPPVGPRRRLDRRRRVRRPAAQPEPVHQRDPDPGRADRGPDRSARSSGSAP